MFENRFYGKIECKKCGKNFTSKIQADFGVSPFKCAFCGVDFDDGYEIKGRSPIYLHEFMYPLMQGYDSVAMDVDVEVCGTDQIFNALVGRTLLKKIKQKEKFVVAVTLMENPKTGDLMSKSKGTGVFLDVSASEMYGQVMSQPDEMMEILFVNVTKLSLSEINEIMKIKNPRDIKMRLAFEIVKIMKGEEKAKEAEENFKTQFQKGEVPEILRSLK